MDTIFGLSFVFKSDNALLLLTYSIIQMKRHSLRILFYLKKSRLLKNGNAPIYMRITLNGKSKEASINEHVDPRMWDQDKNKSRGKTTEHIDLNELLEEIKTTIRNHLTNLNSLDKTVSCDLLMSRFKGEEEKADNLTLINAFKKHNSDMSSLVGIDYSPSTLGRYETSLNHLVNFCNFKYGVSDVFLKDLNFDFITGFEHYLKTEIKCSHNSAMKHVKSLKKITNMAFNSGLLLRQPFSQYKVKIEKSTVKYLTKKELDRLINKEIVIERLALIRDLFVFQCFTGLAYVDLSSLMKKDVETDTDGSKWITRNRQKTGVESIIPLWPIPLKIIERYKDDPRTSDGKLLPVPSNQKMNGYLKELEILCEIDKNLHTHLARHTFATTVALANGVQFHTLSK
ncbi:MAG: site-specific integrase, partial [Flavobacteriales bacterium]|nr:site-specific integrase [Flavobacteriales bacterium]